MLSAPYSDGVQTLTCVAYGMCRCSAWAALRLGSAMGTRCGRVLRSTGNTAVICDFWLCLTGCPM